MTHARAFAVVNLGCKVNRVESDLFSAGLARLGAVDQGLPHAQVVIVNTCTVTSEADHKARKAVRHALAQPLAPTVVVTGCGTAIDPGQFASLSPRVMVEPDRTRVVGLAAGLLGLDPSGVASSDARVTDTPAFERAGRGFRTRVGIKVQDGCDNACTYCIVHVARGKSTSRPAVEVVSEVARAAESGVAEVVITGINLGRYRSVLGRTHEAIGLPGLVATLLERTDIPRIRLSSVEPDDVGDELLSVIRDGGSRVARHLHVPLQSGCQRTLSRMGRKVSAERYAEMARQARQALPDIALTTDMIVGFPGETDEDFAQSERFCRQMGFSRMHVFRYSRRAGTPAAGWPDQVGPGIAAQRAAALRRLSDEMGMEDARSRLGSVELVLFERDGMGTSASYHRVACGFPDATAGRLLPVRLVAVRPDGTMEGQMAGDEAAGEGRGR